MDYGEFLERKAYRVVESGFAPFPIVVPMFPFQEAIARWAIRKGRAAVFADTGLGKTRMQLEWARQVAEKTSGRVLILTPLAVADQTVREATICGVAASHSLAGEINAPIVVANYERLHYFNPTAFAGIVLDESSILKSYSGKTRNELIAAFGATPYRLACTATPAPNDHEELGNHSEFLGVMPRIEMLAEFFCHDGGDTSTWRLKGHAGEVFWKWLASWAVTCRKPSDLGFSDDAYALPPLEVNHEVVSSPPGDAGMLFYADALTLEEQRAARRATIETRVNAAVRVADGLDEPILIWCDLNSEQDALEHAFGSLAFSVRGSDTLEEKELAIRGWIAGERPVMLSKASIMGFGLNLQHCRRMAFVGVTHSFEAFYQAVRRCWRFGQTRPVTCHVITSEAEGAVVANLRRKEADAERMHSAMAEHVKSFVFEEIRGHKLHRVTYAPGAKMRRPEWLAA